MIILVALVDKGILHPISPLFALPFVQPREAYMVPPLARFLSGNVDSDTRTRVRLGMYAKCAGTPRREDWETYN